MSISFLVAAVGTLAALVAIALLIRRCAQSARVDLVAWILALAGMAIGLAAQAAGYHRGFEPTTFRAAQLGLGLVAPLALAWGMAEISARGPVMRFAARLCLSGLFVVAAVILATDVLSDQPFGHDWPLARAHYQLLPLGLLAVIAAVVLVTILVTLAVTALRSRHEPGWRPVLLVLGAAAVAALATQGLLVHLPVNSAYAGLSVVAVVTGWLAGDRAGRVRLAALHGASQSGAGQRGAGQRGAGQRGAGQSGAGQDAVPGGRGTAGPYYARTGSGPGYNGDDSLDLYRDGYGYGGSGAYQAYQGDRYGYDSDAFAAPGSGSQEFPAQGDSRGFAAQGIDPDAEPVTGSFDALYRDGAAPPRPRDAASPAAASESLPGEPETGMQLAALSEAALGAAALADPAADTERLYGQIAIYTLLESGAAEFDRLASTVLEQVRTTEPDTLVFVVHGVPSAPLQRILYQVYRDRAAYDDHQRKSYVTDFDSRLRPLVLATNVIELGVREAKVSSLGPGPCAGRLP